MNTNTIKARGLGLIAAIATFLGAHAQVGAPWGQWDFDAGSLVGTAGTTVGPLNYADAAGTTAAGTAFGTTTSFGIPNIGGAVANVMKFPAGTNGLGYIFPVTGDGNGGGTLINDYTVILEVLYPSAADGKVRPLFQTDDGILTKRNRDFQVLANNGIGSNVGTGTGTILPNTWYRIGFVVTATTITKYINGQAVGTEATGGLDSSFALYQSSDVLLFGNDDANGTPGYVNSIQLRNVALNPGQMLALGTPLATGIQATIPPIPAFIQARSPAAGATGVGPSPLLSITLNSGDSSVATSSIKLYLDGDLVNANVTPSGSTFAITYQIPGLLAPQSPHDLALVYQETPGGVKTNLVSFTVAPYQNVTLPQPIYIETFDGIAEGSYPAGWVATNNTTPEVAGFDLSNPNSDAYKDFQVISTGRLDTVFGARRTNKPFIVLNGVVLDALNHGNLLYADTDNRKNSPASQVNVIFTGDYDLTGKTNVFLAFNSTYEQNQDSIGSVEYSIDQGATWLPAIYYLDDQGGAADIIRTNSVIDITATFGTARGDQAYGLAYSNFIGAPVSAALIPFVAGRINDDQLDGKRIEVIRLAKADNQSKVRFRLGQAGTSSWYFGVDDFGLYSINLPVITTQPLAQTVDAGANATFTVVATGGSPQTYQWQFKGKSIVGATNSTLVVSNAGPANVGLYAVVVSNGSGPVTSNPAQLTVISAPQIIGNPVSTLVSAGASAVFSSSARGGQPIAVQWQFNGAAISGASSNVLTLTNAQSVNVGDYAAVFSNSYGSITSSVAKLSVFSGSITQALVSHLTFDGNYTDTSGTGASGSPVGTPTFETAVIGQGVHIVSNGDDSTNNYVTLGNPPALQFGSDANSNTKNFSIAFWAKLNSQNDDKPFISNKNWDSGSNLGWVIATSGSGMKWNFRDDISGRRDSPTVGAKLLDKSFHHVVVTIDRMDTGRIYIDGVLVSIANAAPDSGKAVGSMDIAANNINLGQDGRGTYTDGGGAAAIDVVMDDLGIWTRLLTPQEVTSMYVQGLAGKDLTTASGAVIVLPPSISAQPVGAVVSTNGTVTLSVTASGLGNLGYQWQKNGVNISSATASNLVISAGAVASSDSYRVIITNPGGQIISSVVTVSVFAGPITQDLVAHIPFDGNYNDTSGRGNNATPKGTPTLVAGKIGQAMKFTTKKDGSNFSYASLGYPTDLQFDTNSFSVSFWANYSNQVDDPAFISNKDWNSSSNPGWGIFSQSNPNFRVQFTGPVSGDKFNTTGTPNIRDGTWHHVAATFWRGQAVAVYADGVPVSRLPFATAGSVDTLSSGKSVNIGQDGTGSYTDNGGAEIVDGLIDDVAIWRRVITAQEVASIFTLGSAGQTFDSAVTPPAKLKITSIKASGGSVVITWTGGTAPYKLDSKSTVLDATWANVSTVSSNSATVPITGNVKFFRISSQ